MVDSLIVKPPRYFQVVIFAKFVDDTRTDQELQQLVAGSVQTSIALDPYKKGSLVQMVPQFPLGVPD